LTDTVSPVKPGDPALCLLCAKPFEAGPSLGCPDMLCGECLQTYKDCAALVCVRCKVVIGKLKPTTLDSGFVIRPRQVLHSDSCNVCQPGVVRSKIIEAVEWERTNRKARTIVGMGSR
jgi:hypothetical protein